MLTIERKVLVASENARNQKRYHMKETDPTELCCSCAQTIAGIKDVEAPSRAVELRLARFGSFNQNNGSGPRLKQYQPASPLHHTTIPDYKSVKVASDLHEMLS